MISSLIKAVMKECGLTQVALADVLGVAIDRVKSLTSGKVQKLTREESESLVRKLHVRGDFLATGQGPIFQSETERRALHEMEKVGTASKTAQRLGLTGEQGRLAMELFYYVQSNDAQGVQRVLAELGRLAPDEAALLDNFRHMAREDQAHYKAVGAALAKSKGVKKKAG